MAEHVNNNPYNINEQNFDANLYLQKLLKDCSLRQIMDRESEIARETQTLHSDMQTLVYENYNKFISATDTIKKMKCDFNQMEESMNSLGLNMQNITESSEKIFSRLQNNSDKISKLTSAHTILKKLQFLFKLPNKLKDTISVGNYSQAVKDYVHSQQVLNRYGNLPSFQGIQKDCETIIDDLKSKIYDKVYESDISIKSLTENVSLLIQLAEAPESLRSDFLNTADRKLSLQLENLKDMCENDVIEFIDIGTSGFLNDLCLIVSSYNSMFIDQQLVNNFKDDLETKPDLKLMEFINNNMQKYFDIVKKKVEDVVDTAVLVRALDRFYLKLRMVNNLCHNSDFDKAGIDIIVSAARKQCQNHFDALKQYLNENLVKVRQTLASKVSVDDYNFLSELQTLLVMPIVEKIKGVLQDLLVFLEPELSFGLKQNFLQRFCVDEVRKGLITNYLNHIMNTANGFCLGLDTPKFPPTLLLLLSKMCLDFKESSVYYILTCTDDLFNIEQYSCYKSNIPSKFEICENFQRVAQELLNHYVRLQGLTVSQMIRKSVDARDWLHTIEPRTVRAVMKRVVEDITTIEAQVSVLYDDLEKQLDQSSDSSKKTYSASKHQYRSIWPSYTPSQLDSSLASNIHKLFSERIEIFSSVEFKKSSILTGIIKITLKTFLECIRLRTFSKYGLQQIQVDTHYLQLYLWRFVNDENLVHFLLDEILGSAVHRCFEPVLMEPSIVDIICERT